MAINLWSYSNGSIMKKKKPKKKPKKDSWEEFKKFYNIYEWVEDGDLGSKWVKKSVDKKPQSR